MSLFNSSNPGIRVRVLPKFPAQVIAGDGMTITYTGGVYTFSSNTGATTGAFDAVFGSTPGMFLKRGTLVWSGGTIIGSDLPAPTTIDRGGIFSLPVTSNSILSGIDATGTPTRATTTGTGDAVRAISPTITGSPTLNSVSISGSGASSTFSINGTLVANNDGTNTKFYIPAAGIDFYEHTGATRRLRLLDAGGISYSGSSSGTHTVVAAAAAGSGTSTWPTTTGTVFNTGMGAPQAQQAVAVNFNAVADYQVSVVLPPGFTSFRIASAIIINTGTTASLTTAQYGIFSAAAGGGTALVASGTALSGITTNLPGTAAGLAAASLGPANSYWTLATLPIIYFRITQAQGAAASGTITYGIVPVA